MTGGSRLVLGAYALLGRVLQPVLPGMLRRRAARGKEEPARLGERWGEPGRARPPGPLIWVHAASVGESLAVLPLVERIAMRPEAPRVLMTSGTVTSAQLLADRLPPGAFHQYVPLDLAPAVDRFLAHWRPQLALFVESELWPLLLSRTAAQGVPLALVNGRMSQRSYRSWRRWRPLAKALLGGFSLLLAEGPGSAARFRALGAGRVVAPGNLKAAAAPLPCEPAAFASLEASLAGRSCWLAASTHPGEELLVAEAQRRLLARRPDLLAIVVPRHPQRGGELAEALKGSGLKLARRSRGEVPEPGTQLYLADTLGELGLFYRVAPIVFVGGSLVPKGGQNLLEPARFGAALLAGPHRENFAEMAQGLEDAGALATVTDAASLAGAVEALLDDPGRRAAMAEAARACSASEGVVLERTLEALEPLLAAACRSTAA